jgi:hypothetical protein
MAEAPQVAFDQGTPIEHQEQKQVLTTAQVYPYWNEAHVLPPLSTHLPLHQTMSMTIFGLRKRNFWILFGIILLVVIATIGGSVGGALAVRDKSEYISPVPTPKPYEPPAYTSHQFPA